MIVASQRYTLERSEHESSKPIFTLHSDGQAMAGENREPSDREVLVLDILESTRRIRHKTDNREILAILDEIVWLTRSL